jgi:hypothetical protein
VRACPVCGSRALSGKGHEEVVGGQSLWLLRCGACETWRSFDLADRSTRRARRRLERSLSWEGLQMVRVLMRVEHRGVDPGALASRPAAARARDPRDSDAAGHA